MDRDLRELERAIAAGPGDVGLRLRHVSLLIQQPRFEDAWTAIREGLAAVPGDAALEAVQGALFDALRAPFTLTLRAPGAAPRTLRFLGNPNGSPTSITIGRHALADVRVSASALAGRHCRIEYEGRGRFLLRDTNTANGTWVDGLRVSAYLLRDGSRIEPAQALEIDFHLGWAGAAWPAPLEVSAVEEVRRLCAEPTLALRGAPPPPPPEADAPLPAIRTGSSIGGYPLERILGRGGFAWVYATRPRPDDAARSPSACIKVAYPTAGGSGSLTRTLGDVLTSQGIPQDHVVGGGLEIGTTRLRFGTVSPEGARAIIAAEFDALASWRSDLFPEPIRRGDDRGLAFYVMEQIVGSSVRDRLRARRRAGSGALWPRGALLRLLGELASLAERVPGFYHGDLKPENMLVAGERIRLIDPAYRTGAGFGFARTLTPAYNPLALEGEAADTVALALVLIEGRTGAQPFANATVPGDRLPGPQTLGLERFTAWRDDPELARALDWIARPPRYREMAAALASSALA